jgi:MFS family permease
MMGVAGAALSSICFGFSHSLPAMLFARSIAGGLSGNIAVVSTMLSEITDETNQGKGEQMPNSFFVAGFAMWMLTFPWVVSISSPWSYWIRWKYHVRPISGVLEHIVNSWFRASISVAL